MINVEQLWYCHVLQFEILKVESFNNTTSQTLVETELLEIDVFQTYVLWFIAENLQSNLVWILYQYKFADSSYHCSNSSMLFNSNNTRACIPISIRLGSDQIEWGQPSEYWLEIKNYIECPVISKFYQHK